MKTDLASLLSALTAQPGLAAQASVGGDTCGLAVVAAGTSGAVDASGQLVATPAATTATAFQAALASQVQTVSPAVQHPSQPALPGYSAAPAFTAQSENPAAPLLPAALPVPVAFARVTVRPTIAGRATLAAPAPAPNASTMAETPLPAAPSIELPACAAVDALQSPLLPAPTDRPATACAGQRADGKLPSNGNMLPVDPAPASPQVFPQPAAMVKGDAVDDPADDRSADPIPAIDLGAQPLLAPVIVTVQPVLPPVPIQNSSANPAVSSPVGRTPAATKIAGTAPSPALASDPVALAPSSGSSPAAAPTPGPIVPAPFATGTPTVPASTLAAAQAPAPALAPSIAQLPSIGAGIPPVPAQSVSISLVSPPLAVTLPAPALTHPVQASLSTASRLARQPGVSRSADFAAAADDNSDALLPGAGVLPAAAGPVSVAASVASPAATPPQDFAVLVDRLLEARASAQSSTTPQQISTSVTHSDFGKVSLTFQQDAAGLSVSMASADPGFARAAQSAMATSGQAGAGQSPTAGQLSSGHFANSGLAGSSSQSFAQPDAPAPANSATGQNAGFPTGSGGSPQSHAQHRPGFIAAANRSPAATGNAAATDPGQGIFA